MGLINAINCNKDNLGLGIVSCMQFFGEPKTPILIRKGWRMAVADFQALDSDGFVALVQSGDWDPNPGAKQFTMDIPDATTEEYSGGIVAVVRNGKPTLTFTYDQGIAKHKALYSRNSFGQYDMGLVDETGNLMLALTADGQYVTGISTGMVNTGTYNFKNGDTSSSSPFAFQFINEDQFNRRMMVYSVEQSQVDFNEELLPITSVTITGTVSAADGFDININAWSNAGYGIEAISGANLRAVNVTDNAVLTIGGFTEGSVEGNYSGTLTPSPGAGDKVVFSMYDATATPPVAVALVDTNLLYKGQSQEITVTA